MTAFAPKRVLGCKLASEDYWADADIGWSRNKLLGYQVRRILTVMTRPTRFDGMMHELCVGLGFCGGLVDGEPRHVTGYIPKEGQVSADEFVYWLLLAEGFNPQLEKRWKKELKAVFIKHMKSETVDASQFIYTGFRK